MLFKGLQSNTYGTSAIEFALLAPVLALFLVGIADISRALARKFQIEQASYRSLELMTVGALKTDYQDYIKAEAMEASGEPADNIQVVNWRECDGVKQEQFEGTCSSTQQVARFVRVEISSYFTPIFSYGPLGQSFGLNVDGKVRLGARSTLRVQ